MNEIPQCCYVLLLAVERRDQDVMCIWNLVRGTSYSMHIHHQPSFSHVVQKTDYICFELSIRYRRVNYSWWLMGWNCVTVFELSAVRTQVQRWSQWWAVRCKWTSQIWNVAHCLGALDRGHCAYTYDVSQICRNMMCLHSWIDKLLIAPVILM